LTDVPEVAAELLNSMKTNGTREDDGTSLKLIPIYEAPPVAAAVVAALDVEADDVAESAAELCVVSTKTASPSSIRRCQ
jgi:hypothetical protein